MIIFLNLYYLIHYLLLSERELFTVQAYSNLQGSPIDQHGETLHAAGGATFITHYNGQHLFFNVRNDILYFHREGKRVQLMTVHGNLYPINESISNLEQRFSDEGLCRINRSTIINFKLVKGYVAGIRRDTAQPIIKPAYLSFIKDPQSSIFLVTKDFLNSFKLGLEKL